MNSSNTFSSSRLTSNESSRDREYADDSNRDARDASFDARTDASNTEAGDVETGLDAERQATHGDDSSIDNASASVEVTSHSLSRESLASADSAFLKEMTALVPTLRAFGRSLCANKSWADDLVQETMLKAWSGRERYQVGSNMKAWMLTILRNQYYSELRHKRFEVADPNDEHASRMSVPPEHEAASQMEMLSYALTKLSNEQREAILLVCASGLSYKQAAVICNCAVGTIKSRIARARDHLLQWLGGEGAGGNPFASAGITERQSSHAVAS
jgi:RNA polymerase sigma-70 factor (ECF subfamily)